MESTHKITVLIFTAVNTPTSVVHLPISVFIFCPDPSLHLSQC